MNENVTEQDSQLVAAIVAAVLERLRERKASPGEHAPSEGETPRADIRPPVGVCTGDYSKFEELRGRLNAPRAPKAGGEAASAATSRSMPVQPAVLTGIVTERQLREAMASGPDGVALLSSDARLTPLASDLARELPEKVRRVARNHAAVTTPAGVTLPWMIWSDGRCPAVEMIQRAFAGQLRRTAAPQDPAEAANVVRDLSALVRSGQAAGGLLFVAAAARAMCFANRCRSLRAVLGTCEEAVRQGVDELGANVLVIEYPHVGNAPMVAMVERMVAHPPRANPAVQRTLADLERCD